ncbi:MAG TPA: 2Fe-2S iron-sulfur cluster binding domain-containing protein [Thermodesulfobacteriaceae bacterium]|nr:2Fe-2S iron-sulfur cluster binding domain-containing protein [Thermodesulfobacteriaceae bacterium]
MGKYGFKFIISYNYFKNCFVRQLKCIIWDKVAFLPTGRSIRVNDGENLLNAARLAGVHINASCGGSGVCGKCRIIFESWNIEGGISEKLSKEDYAGGFRQACLSTVKSDLVLRIPEDSLLASGVGEECVYRDLVLFQFYCDSSVQVGPVYAGSCFPVSVDDFGARESESVAPSG